MKNQIRSNMWRWWCGGGVIAVAVVLGCATAITTSGGGAKAPVESHASPVTPAKVKRGVAAAPGFELPHNGGKMGMPITVSFDGDPELVVTRETSVTVSITAEAGVTSVEGVIEGADGLEGVRQPFTFTQIASGQTEFVNVSVPAKNGNLIIRMQGVVGADPAQGISGQPMTASPTLRIKNPKEVKASSANKLGPVDLNEPVTRDAMGQVVQPMRASE